MAGRDGEAEEKVLQRLRVVLSKRFGNASFRLEPFGSFVTQLGLRHSGEGRSDLDVVMLFRDSAADTIARREVRDRLVGPTISALGRWLPSLHGVVVKSVIRHARVPIVKFETMEVSVDISVQQPWGVLNSWHMRDLCNSGQPGRLRSLARMVKAWAKSKDISTATDGSLNSYGYSMLAASFLQDCYGLPSILPRASRAGGSPYMDADEALEHVLAASSGRRASLFCRRRRLWSPPERFEPDDLSEMTVFLDWLRWMATTVLGFADARSEAPGGVGTVPLEHRHIVSVRRGTQEELRSDVSWSPKVNEHWEPGKQEVFMLIEEPLNGENVARCVRAEGFWTILAEVDRAWKYLAGARGRRDGGSAAFQALLGMPSVSHVRRQLPNSVGLPSQRMGPMRGSAKRPRMETAGEAEAQTALPTLPGTRTLHEDPGTKPDEAKEEEEEEAEDEQLVSPERVNGQWSGGAVREIGAPAAPAHAHALANIHPAEPRVKPVFCAGARAVPQDVPPPGGQVEQPAPQGGGHPMPRALRWSFSATTGHFCILWSVESRKLRGSDQQVESPSFDLTYGGRPAKFKMLLDAMQVTDQKGGGSFGKTNGSCKGSVSVKCEADLSAGMGSLTYRLFIGSGDTTNFPQGILITQQPPRGPVTHDFFTSAFSSLPSESKEWDFSVVTDEASQTFIVGLEVQQ